ncbi:MAG: hypothetical protein JSW11_09705 [Candidatus Heimdallarchaeota archaeon]|nr:MAG: hypothetical protein JSW11_09705 [Candidatus Heimdallarchaeota archaeon]
MKNELKRVYEIIPPDSLYQIEGEEHRTLLSEEEVEFVVEYCVENDMDDMDGYILPIIRKLELARVAAITSERFFKGELDVVELNNDGDIIWGPKNA